MGLSAPARTALCLAAIATCVGPCAASPAPAPPIDPGLTEGVESRLVQFEVRVTRKGAPVHGLTAKDLDIELSGKPLPNFTVDDMCAVLDSEGVAPAPRPGSFVFYFDEPELTVEGRMRAIEVARIVAPELLAHGHDVLILHNGNALRAETKWTHDAAEVSAALDRIASTPNCRESIQSGADEMKVQMLLDRAESLVRESEFNRKIAYDDAQSAMANGAQFFDGPSGQSMLSAKYATPTSPHAAVTPSAMQAMADAQMYENEGTQAINTLLSEFDAVVSNDLQRTGRDIERLRGAVRLAALRGSPKGVVYFADSLRRDPGGVVQRAMESIPSFTNRNGGDTSRAMASSSTFRRMGANPALAGLSTNASLSGIGSRSRSGVASWDADGDLVSLVRDASTYGIRFYAVEGRSLAGASDWVRASQDTLAGLALETGGLSFVNGVSARKIADGITADQSCWYLVSFSPSGWETDRTLDVGVWTKQLGLHVTTLSSLVIPSRATRTRTRLLAAHLGDPSLEDHPLAVSIYPVGGTAKRLQVLAQVRMPDSDVPKSSGATWDIGFEVISRGAVVAHSSGRVAWHGNGPPPVYQTSLALPAGPYEVVAVAREDATDSIRAGRANGTWPPLSENGVTLSLPVVAQPQRGGLVLDGDVKATGIIVRGGTNPVDPREPTAIVTAACLDGTKGAPLRAERSLVGETEVSFAPMELTPDEGRCVQIRDLVAARSLGAGRLTYFVRILSGEQELAAQELSFDVADVPAATPTAIAPPSN
jgi:hypothetical protein